MAAEPEVAHEECCRQSCCRYITEQPGKGKNVEIKQNNFCFAKE